MNLSFFRVYRGVSRPPWATPKNQSFQRSYLLWFYSGSSPQKMQIIIEFLKAPGPRPSPCQRRSCSSSWDDYATRIRPVGYFQAAKFLSRLEGRILGRRKARVVSFSRWGRWGRVRSGWYEPPGRGSKLGFLQESL